MRGVYLHVMGDLFGSVVVILSAGITAWHNNCKSLISDSCQAHNEAISCGNFLLAETHNGSISSIAINNKPLDDSVLDLMFPGTKVDWIAYVDPVTSIILTMLIVFTTLKTVKGKSPFYSFIVTKFARKK